jgi:hypothetical protein
VLEVDRLTSAVGRPMPLLPHWHETALARH